MSSSSSTALTEFGEEREPPSTFYVIKPSFKEGVSLFNSDQDYIVSAHGGASHILFCTASGKVFSYGSNDQGQCGLGDRVKSTSDRLMQVRSLPPCKQVASGYEYSMFLTCAGEVYGTGQGQYGQLGVMKRVPLEYSPVKLEFFDVNQLCIEKIACGYYHTLCLTTLGHVYSFGHAHNGQCGIDLTKFPEMDGEICKPILISSLAEHRIVQMAPGGYHTVVMTNTGRLFGFGANTFGQLTKSVTRDEHYNINVMLPMEIMFNHGIPKKIVSGGEFSSVLTVDGHMYTTGSNNEGQLGLPSVSDRTPTFERCNFLSGAGALSAEVRSRLEQDPIDDVCHSKYQNVVITKSGAIYLTGAMTSNGRLRQFKSLRDSCNGVRNFYHDVEEMVRWRRPNSEIRLFSSYNDIIIAVVPADDKKLEPFFEKLRRNTKYQDVEILTVR